MEATCQAIPNIPISVTKVSHFAVHRSGGPPTTSTRTSGSQFLFTLAPASQESRLVGRRGLDMS